MSMESVTALLKDPRKRKFKKPADKSTGIQNAIQRRVANGSFDKGLGRTGANADTRNLVKGVKDQYGSGTLTGPYLRSRTVSPENRSTPSLGRNMGKVIRRRFNARSAAKRKFF